MEPDHIKVYWEGLWRLCTLSHFTQKILITILRRMTSAECGMTVLMNASVKVTLCKQLEITGVVLNAKLKELKEIGMIRLRTRNLYEVNPHMFGKGDWVFIKRLQKTWVSCEGKNDGASSYNVT